jgi:hypothetical protein
MTATSGGAKTAEGSVALDLKEDKSTRKARRGPKVNFDHAANSHGTIL